MQIESDSFLHCNSSRVLRLHKKTVHPSESSKCTPKRTCVPPHVPLMSKIQELMLKFSRLRGDLKDDFGGILDTKGVDGSEFHINQIFDVIKALGVQTSSSASVPMFSESSNMVMSDEKNDLEVS